MQSGVALNPFVFSNTKVTELMEIMDINVNSEEEALEILMGLSVEELFAAQEKLMAVSINIHKVHNVWNTFFIFPNYRYFQRTKLHSITRMFSYYKNISRRS